MDTGVELTCEVWPLTEVTRGERTMLAFLYHSVYRKIMPLSIKPSNIISNEGILATNINGHTF